jgi:hypothetical protein
MRGAFPVAMGENPVDQREPFHAHLAQLIETV